jgi:hypothetical protein
MFLPPFVLQLCPPLFRTSLFFFLSGGIPTRTQIFFSFCSQFPPSRCITYMTPSSSHVKKSLFSRSKIISREQAYPASLLKSGISAPIHIIGDPGLLCLPAMALFCSIQCPGSIILKTYEAMQRLKLQDRALAGGFHSPMERTCLDILLRGRIKLIVCPARGIRRLRVRPEWRDPLAENRLVIVSPFDDAIRRSTTELASTRNRFVAALANSLLIPFAARKSHTEEFAIKMISEGKTVYTFDDPEAQRLIDLGAQILPLSPKDPSSPACQSHEDLNPPSPFS